MKTAMRDPGLDFQPQRPGLVPVALLCASLLIAGDAAFEEMETRGRRDEASQVAAQAEKRRDRSEMAQRQKSPESLLTPEEAKALQLADQALAIQWERLFTAVDRAVTDDVALLAIRPNLPARSVQISGEARDMAAALVFAEALRQAPVSRVVLISHSVRSSEPGRPIAFEISAEWSANSRN